MISTICPGHRVAFDYIAEWCELSLYTTLSLPKNSNSPSAHYKPEELRNMLCHLLQLQMEVWHVGSFRFKGVPEPMHVMHLGNSIVNGRVFPSHTPSKKAERVAPALGLQCIVGVSEI